LNFAEFDPLAVIIELGKNKTGAEIRPFTVYSIILFQSYMYIISYISFQTMPEQ
jgi:hypothetical protein